MSSLILLCVGLLRICERFHGLVCTYYGWKLGNLLVIYIQLTNLATLGIHRSTPAPVTSKIANAKLIHERSHWWRLPSLLMAVRSRPCPDQKSMFTGCGSFFGESPPAVRLIVELAGPEEAPTGLPRRLSRNIRLICGMRIT